MVFPLLPMGNRLYLEEKGIKIKEKLVYTHKSIANKPSFGGFKKNKQAVVKNKVNQTAAFIL